MPKVVVNGFTYEVTNEIAQTIHDLMEQVTKGKKPGFSWVFEHLELSGEVPIKSSHKLFVGGGAALTITDWP